MEELTKVEERIMMIFWDLKKAFVKDVIAQIKEEPKPPYSTISSVARILANKGYLKYKIYGKTYEYYPAVSQLAYRKFKLKRILTGHFDNSPAALVSFLIKGEKLNKEEVQKLKDIINKIN
jgi:BlaI family transcriptional regulator, penicillinase repressor